MCCRGAYARFDGSIIAEELRRAGLDAEVDVWNRVSKKTSTCTMDPDIGKWICQCFGKDTVPEYCRVTLKLDELLNMLKQEEQLNDVMKGARHTAGHDADLHRAAYTALHRLCRKCG